MDKIKQWVAVAVLAVLAIGAGSWFLLVSPKKAEANDLNAEAETTSSESQGLRNDIKALQAQAKALPAQRAKLAAVAAKLPAEAAMPALIRALTSAADAAGVKFVSLTPGAPVAAVTTTTPTTPSTGADGDAAPAAPVSTATGLVTIPVEITVFGGYYQAQQFASRLESLPRAFRVKALDIKPGADPGNASTADADAATDGQNLVTVISGEVFMSTVTASPTTTTALAGATGSAK